MSKIADWETRAGEKLTTAISAYPADIKSGSGTFLIREVFSEKRREETYRDVLRMRRVANVKGKERRTSGTRLSP